MTKQEFIKNVLDKFEISNLDKNKLSEQLDIYKTFLQEQNAQVNLTRLDKDDIIWSKYFWQSMMVYRLVDFNTVKTVLDVGSGSGIPGFVIKLFFPNIKLTVVESSHKKCEFMKQLAEKLHLANVEVINQRIEQTSTKRQFDMVTAKAVAPVETILELITPFAKSDGLVVVPKGKNYLAEVKDLNQELKQLSASLLTVDYILDDGIDFYTIIAKKHGKTNPKYPRDYKKIIKGFDYGK
ncbi:MAG: 16S rRNA (guanine(527)-N(7))-methyltransferase RsmG [Mycoplasma sp.]|nr:16S rRNA (guanine(527)-N(7))-methyltransferase RsmG [Candidatus Hennigella equi]